MEAAGKGRGLCVGAPCPVQQSVSTSISLRCSENKCSVLGMSCLCSPATTCCSGGSWDSWGGHRQPQARESQIRDDTGQKIVPAV